MGTYYTRPLIHTETKILQPVYKKPFKKGQRYTSKKDVLTIRPFYEVDKDYSINRLNNVVSVYSKKNKKMKKLKLHKGSMYSVQGKSLSVNLINSIIDLPTKITNSKVLFIDLETNGLDETYNEILEVGYRLNGVVYNEYVRGSKAGATEINKITQDALDNGKYNINEILNHLVSLDFDLIVGHNISFDVGFLLSWCRKKRNILLFKKLITTPVFCTSQMGRFYHNMVSTSKTNSHLKLGDLYDFLDGPNFYIGHNTLEDVAMTEYCYIELLKKIQVLY